MTKEKKEEIEILETLVANGIQSSGQGYMFHNLISKYPVEFYFYVNKHKPDLSTNETFARSLGSIIPTINTNYERLKYFILNKPISKKEIYEFNKLVTKLELLLLYQNELN